MVAPGSSATIRPLAPCDSVSEITELLHRAYAPLRQRGLHYVASNQDEATTRRRIARGECYVAEWDCRLVGTVTFRPASETSGCEWYDRADVASFEQLAVEPGVQGRGIGGALVDIAEHRALATGGVQCPTDPTTEGTPGWMPALSSWASAEPEQQYRDHEDGGKGQPDAENDGDSNDAGVRGGSPLDDSHA